MEQLKPNTTKPIKFLLKNHIPQKKVVTFDMKKKASLIGNAVLSVAKKNLTAGKVYNTAISGLASGPEVASRKFVDGLTVGGVNVGKAKRVLKDKTFDKKNPNDVKMLPAVQNSDKKIIPNL